MIWICFALTLAACWYDLRTREIPDILSLGLAVAGLVCVALGGLSWQAAIGGLLVGFALTAPFFYAGGLGGGDVKLVAALGIGLGPLAMLSVLFWIAIAGALLSIATAVRGQRDLAYAPAIAAGVLAYALAPSLLSKLIGIA